MKKRIFKAGVLAFLLVCPVIIFSQTIVTTPTFPTDQDSTVVIYDATKGNAGLIGVAPPIYAHTGVITDQSTSNSDWRYTIAPWSLNLPKALLTSLGNNLYKIVLRPSIRAYYGVPAGEVIKKLAFVFRNADGTKTGREANDGDIFGDVYAVGGSINIVLPATTNLFVRQGTTIPVKAMSPMADSMFIHVNNALVKKVAGKAITDTLIADNFGSDWVKYYVRISAKNDTAAVADSFSYTVIPGPPITVLPAGMQDGINYINDSTVILSLFAPKKTCCFAVGDFNNWQQGQQAYMNLTPDSAHYWIELDHLTPHREYIYQYLVDGTLAIGDPYADKVSDPEDSGISSDTYPGLLPYPSGKASGIATVFQTAQAPYPWNTAAFTPPKVTDLVIYELLIRDFTIQHTYTSVMDTLGYLQRLGVNAIELMPVMEFEGNSSWGYNPDYMFAADKYYGPKNSLKALIDAAHARGMAVILDIVLNHQFGQSPLVRLYWDAANNRPMASSPWFNAIPKHPYNVGYDFNHETPFTRSFCERVVKYWLTEYHVDGYRFDLSKGFTQLNSYPDNVSLWGQYNASRITILKNYNNVIRTVKPDAYVILEHFAGNDEEKELSSNGMLLWENMNGPSNEATMGYVSGTSSDISGLSYQQRGWADPHVVGYMESHDEERLMYKNVTYGNSSQFWYNLKDSSIALNRVAMAAALFFTVPGPKMIWEFGELGYDYSINYPCMTADCRLSPKPARWDYLSQWKRRYLSYTFAALTDLKKNNDAFESSDFTINLAGAQKYISIRSSSMDVAVCGNFDVVAGTISPGFHQGGTWYDYLSGDSITVTSPTMALTLQAGEYHIYTSKKLAKPLYTGIGEDTLPGLQKTTRAVVFPNPASERILIESSYRIEELILFDLSGHKLRSLSGAGEMELKGIKPGLYLLKIRYADQVTETMKISKY